MARQARTTENLKERMADSLLELLAEKPYTEISVSEITDLADVGRATYYRHFASKDEVLFFKFSTIFDRTPHSAPNAADHSENHAITYFEEYFTHLSAHRHVLQRIYDAGLDYLLFLYMYRYTAPTSPSSTLLDQYRNAIHSVAIFALVDKWITSGFKQTPEELANMIVHQLFRH